MTTESYYLTPSATGTAFTGSGYTPDGTIPSGAVPCTQAQAQAYQSYVPDGKGGFVDAPATVLLAQAQSAQIAILTASRNATMLAPVSFKTAAGTTAMFSTSVEAISYLQGVIDAGSAAWVANLWLSNAGTPITPFTFADVQGLAAAIEAVDTPEYQELLKLIGEVMAATTVSAVEGVIWA
ncbi:MAG: hypothetical protein ACYCY2_06480 [Acidithiobacillus ferriphilus]